MQTPATGPNPRLAALLLASIAVTASLAGMPAAWSLMPESPAPPIEDVSVSVEGEGPAETVAGTRYTVSFNVTNDGVQPRLVVATPMLDSTSTADCYLASVGFEYSGTEVEKAFLLLPSGDNSLREGFGENDIGDGFEPSHALPMSYIRIDIGIQTAQGVVGKCVARMEIASKTADADVLDPVGVVFNTLQTLIYELPPTPILFGKIETIGGPLQDDRVSYTLTDVAGAQVSDLGEIPIVSAVGNVKVNYTALYNHDDDPDVGDRGKFYFTKDALGGPRLGSKWPIDEHKSADQTLWYVEEFAAHEQSAVYTRCVVGQYIDGGVYDDTEDTDGGCVKLNITQVPVDGLGVTLPEVEDLVVLSLGGYVWNLAPGPTPVEVREMVDRVGSVLVRMDDGRYLYVDTMTLDALDAG